METAHTAALHIKVSRYTSADLIINAYKTDINRTTYAL